MNLTDRDEARLDLLDRIEQRLPEVNLDEHLVEWTTLPDGHEALVIDGGGFEPTAEDGCFMANAGDDLHVIGPLGTSLGCLVVDPAGTRRLAGVIDDPAARDS